MAHPRTFLNGHGVRSKNVTMVVYVNTLLNRYPAHQYAENPFLPLDAFNIIERHEVNKQSAIQWHSSPHLLQNATNITPDDYETVSQLLSGSLYGTDRVEAMQGLSPTARHLYRACRGTLAKMSMSPQDILHLRSQAVASWYMHGTWTMFLTFNPSETTSAGIFQLANHGYVP